MNNTTIRVALAAWALAAGVATASETPETGPRPLRVLFIGSSLTYQNSLPNRFRALVTQYDGRPVEVVEATLPGSGLRRHWDGRARTRVNDGGWDYVVLQPGFDTVPTAEYPRLFDEEIRKGGAKTVLFMTWALRGNTARQGELDEAFTRVAREVSVIAAPVGPAWALAEKRQPGIGLYNQDDLHPSSMGTYLTACVFYSTILDKPLPTDGATGSTTVAHEVAWEAVQLWRAKAATPAPPR